MAKIIIECAVTGRRLPSESHYLPITPEEIARQIVACQQAGASIAHFHVNHPRNGKPAVNSLLFREIAAKVKKHCDVILCPVIDADPGLTIEKRLEIVRDCQPEMASISLGPTITPDFQLLKRNLKFKYQWEKKYLEQSYKICEPFNYKILETCVRTMCQHGTMPELEVSDTKDINTIAWMLGEEIIKKPLYLQFMLGAGLRLSADYILHLYKTAKELLGEFDFAVSASEKTMLMSAVSLALGGHARVGLGDAVENERGGLVKGSSEQVASMAQIIEGMGYEVATPAEVRDILRLKGRDKVNF